MKRFWHIGILLFLLASAFNAFAQQDDSNWQEEEESEYFSEEKKPKFIDKGKIDQKPTTVHHHLQDDLKEKYRSKEYNYAGEDQSGSIASRIREWLFKKILELFQVKDIDKGFNVLENILNAFLVIVFIAFLWFLIRIIIKKDVSGLFRKKVLTTDESIEAELEEVIKQGSFESMIAKYYQNGDYRAAVRYYFAWVLDTLDKKGLIHFKPEKTALEYKYEIKNQHVSKQYDYALYLFNNIWYGYYEINENEYKQSEQNFLALIRNE